MFVIREFSLFPALTTDCTGNSLCKILSLTDGSRALRTNYQPSHSNMKICWKTHTTRTTLSRLDSLLKIFIASYNLFPGSPVRFTESRKRERYLSDQESRTNYRTNNKAVFKCLSKIHIQSNYSEQTQHGLTAWWINQDRGKKSRLQSVIGFGCAYLIVWKLARDF